MRSKIILLFWMTAALVLTSTNLFAQAGLSVSFSPVVGDTLDGFERQQLGLFPDVDGFLWAVFFLDEGGGNLKAKICSIYEGRMRLQILNMGITLEFLRRKIELTFGLPVKLHDDRASEGRPAASESSRREKISKLRLLSNPTTDKVIILSPRVGREIDIAERNRFSLFLQLKGFVRAMFFQTPETSYYAQVFVSGTEGSIRDTLIEYSQRGLLMLAERINHFEGLAAGTYRMRQQPVAIQSEQGEEILLQDAAADSLLVSLGWQIGDVLPFADTLASIELPRNLDWGFGISLSTYSPDLSGFEVAMNAIEDSYRAQGYSIGRHSPDYRISPLVWYNLRLRLNESFTLFAETARSTREIDFKAFSVSVHYYPRESEAPQFNPFFGVGFGRYYLRVSNTYRNNVGGYNFLDEINIEAASFGMKFLGGYEMEIADVGRLSAQAEYLYIPQLNTTVENTSVVLRLSSLTASVRLSFLLFEI